MDDIRDINDVEDLIMVNQMRGRRARPDFLVDVTDLDFKRNFQFSKDGAVRLVELLGDHLTHEDNRGRPLTPVQQVRNSASKHMCPTAANTDKSFTHLLPPSLRQVIAIFCFILKTTLLSN